MARPLLLLGLLSSCSGPVFIPSPWEPDQLVVLSVIGSTSSSPEITRVVSGDEPIEIMLEAGEPIQIFARVYDSETLAPNGSLISECGVVIGGEGAPLPEPAARWRSDLFDPAEVSSPTLVPDEPSDEMLDLRFDGCGLDPCSGVAFTPIDFPAEFSGQAVVAVSSDSAYFSGRAVSPSRASLVRLEGDSWTVQTSTRSSSFYQLSWDGTDRWYGVLNDPGNYDLVRLSMGTQLSLTVVRSFADWAFLSAGGDGGMFFGSRDGGLFVIPRDGGPLTPILGYPGDEAQDLAAIDESHMFIRDAARDAIYEYLDGEFSLDRPSAQDMFFEEVNEMDASEELAVVVGGLELVELRRAPRRWEVLPGPFNLGLTLHGTAVLDSGRIAVLAGDGSVAVWNHEGWCTSDSRQIQLSYGQMAATRDRHVAFAVGSDKQGNSIAWKVQVE